MAEVPGAKAKYGLPGGQERAIEAAFDVAPGASGGYRVERIWVERSLIRATYRGAEGDVCTLIARHPEDAPDCERRTARFTLEGELPEPLLRHLEHSLPSAEDAIQWARTEDAQGEASGEAHSDARDAELLAFYAGTKPALRRAVASMEAARTLKRELEGSGFGSCISTQALHLGGEPRFVAYGARSLAEAERLRGLDAGAGQVSPAMTSQNNHALGEALGYPSCCVEAFDHRDRQLNSFLRHRLRLVLHYRYLGARRAYSSHNRWELNPHLAGEGVSLVSFEPCRYDCPRALEVARATLDVVREVDAAAAAVMETRLRCTLAVSRRGDIIVLNYDTRVATGMPRLLGTQPVSTASRLPPAASSMKSARALERRPPRAEPPRHWNWWSPVVVDFVD